MKIIYDKRGAAFALDHEYGGWTYVRPMVKVVTQRSIMKIASI